MLNFITPLGVEKDREDFVRNLNRRAGKGNWFWAFRVGKKLYAYDLGMQMYEDAYWLYLRQDIQRVKTLVSKFDVFMNDRHDLESSLDYRKQEHKWREHFADIAIRRCLRRFGVWFQGKDIMEITKTEYDDRSVPFHLPHLIHSPDKTARSWLDANRLVVVAKEVEDKCKLAQILVK